MASQLQPRGQLARRPGRQERDQVQSAVQRVVRSSSGERQDAGPGRSPIAMQAMQAKQVRSGEGIQVWSRPCLVWSGLKSQPRPDNRHCLAAGCLPRLGSTAHRNHTLSSIIRHLASFVASIPTPALPSSASSTVDCRSPTSSIRRDINIASAPVRLFLPSCIWLHLSSYPFNPTQQPLRYKRPIRSTTFPGHPLVQTTPQQSAQHTAT